MKNHFLAAGCLALLACLSCGSLADVSGHRDAVERLFELTGMQQKIDTSVDSVLAIQLAQNPALREHQSLVHGFLEKHIGWSAMKDDLVAMYMQAFTEVELQEIATFYSSPTGQKLLTQLPELIEQRNRLAMQRLQENADELQKAINADKPE